MFHPFGPDQTVSYSLDLFPLSLHGDELQAIVLIQLDMHVGNNQIMMMVLDSGKEVEQFRCRGRSPLPGTSL